MISLREMLYYIIKGIDGIITPLILLLTKIIIVDSPVIVSLGKLRGLILLPFIKCKSIPSIGKDVYFSELLTRKYVFGKNVGISNFCKLFGPIEIGDNVDINYNVQLRPQTIIGNNVGIGPNTLFMTDTHDLGNEKKRAGKHRIKKIVVEDGCWIGANVIVLGGVTIGAGSVIGAGSIIDTDVKPNSLVVSDRSKKTREIRKLNFLRKS
jgi:acetyltransferase-like isoleucine patch superfamily enzyme